MKYGIGRDRIDGKPSPPSRAAWIEIEDVYRPVKKEESPPSRAAWIEIIDYKPLRSAAKSPPSRAAWIEILLPLWGLAVLSVAAFTGGVD